MKFDSDIITFATLMLLTPFIGYFVMKKIKKDIDLLWAFLGYTIGAVFLTWPLSLHLKTSIVGGLGDNIYCVWLIRWYQTVFLEGQGHPFFNPRMNYPQGWNLSTVETTLASTLPGVPFSYFFGPIAGYNIAILITFVFAGFFMYLWIRDLTKSKVAAFLAGVIFTFSPFHFSHFLVGHLNLCDIQWFPLFFWGLTRLLKSDHKFEWKFVLLTGVSLGLIGFTSIYYLYMSLFYTPIFIIFYLTFQRFKPIRNKFFWINLVSGLAISLPFIFFALRPFIHLASTGTLASRSLEYAAMYSASPTDFFLPATDHFLFGKLFSTGFDRSLWLESTFYIGFTALFLAIIAIINRKKTQHRELILSSIIIVIISFILCLGINLHWNNQDVVWQIPGFLQPLFHKTETLIYLPAAWLFNHMPFFDKMRTIMRFGFFVLLFIPVLAGIGFQQIQNKLTTNRKIIFTCLIFVLVLFEVYPGSYAQYISQPQPRQVDLWLAQQPDDGAVVQMPFDENSSQAQCFYTLYHKKPFVGGEFNANQPIQYLEIQPVLQNFPDEHSVELLRKLDVKYIVVDSAAYPNLDEFKQQAAAFGLTELADVDNNIVYTFSIP